MLGYGDSLFIRRCRAGRGFGIVDLMLLPAKGPHRIVLVEAKLADSAEASAKVVGQLLLYYAGVLHIGMRGLRMLRNFAESNSARARSCSPKLLKSLSGGISPPEDAWREFQKGKKIQPAQIGLFIALDGEAPQGLKSLLQNLAINHHLEVGVITVLGRNRLTIWKPYYPH